METREPPSWLREQLGELSKPWGSMNLLRLKTFLCPSNWRRDEVLEVPVYVQLFLANVFALCRAAKEGAIVSRSISREENGRSQDISLALEHVQGPDSNAAAEFAGEAITANWFIGTAFNSLYLRALNDGTVVILKITVSGHEYDFVDVSDPSSPKAGEKRPMTSLPDLEERLVESLESFPAVARLLLFKCNPAEAPVRWHNSEAFQGIPITLEAQP